MSYLFLAFVFSLFSNTYWLYAYMQQLLMMTYYIWLWWKSAWSNFFLWHLNPYFTLSLGGGILIFPHMPSDCYIVHGFDDNMHGIHCFNGLWIHLSVCHFKCLNKAPLCSLHRVFFVWNHIPTTVFIGKAPISHEPPWLIVLSSTMENVALSGPIWWGISGEFTPF